MTNTRAMTVSKKQKAKLEKMGAIVESKSKLPPHLAALLDSRAKKMEALDMYEVTVDLSKYDDSHPIHALL